MCEYRGTTELIDHDGDGDVDWLDLLKWAADKPLGKLLRLGSLHQTLNERHQATLENLMHRIDKLEENLTGAEVHTKIYGRRVSVRPSKQASGCSPGSPDVASLRSVFGGR